MHNKLHLYGTFKCKVGNTLKHASGILVTAILFPRSLLSTILIPHTVDAHFHFQSLQYSNMAIWILLVFIMVKLAVNTHHLLGLIFLSCLSEFVMAHSNALLEGCLHVHIAPLCNHPLHLCWNEIHISLHDINSAWGNGYWTSEIVVICFFRQDLKIMNKETSVKLGYLKELLHSDWKTPTKVRTYPWNDMACKCMPTQ